MVFVHFKFNHSACLLFYKQTSLLSLIMPRNRYCSTREAIFVSVLMKKKHKLTFTDCPSETLLTIFQPTICIATHSSLVTVEVHCCTCVKH
ncbi:Cell cycle checkpoint control protein RAD9A [Trichinella spiralis]|uniref:Cell cycle checkpoint control protein RAD9A n=1 Tax=Trichinella spiralis TaxID=6334 RepID=A0ABR3KZY9_TRISP